MRCSSIVIKLIYLCFLLFACSSTTVTKHPSRLNLKIVKNTLAKNVKQYGKTSKPVFPTSNFTTDCDCVVSHIIFTHLSGKHFIRWEWYDPQNKMYHSSGNFPLQAPHGKYITEGATCNYLPIKGTDVMNNTGNWFVKIYVDDVLAAIDDFTITSAEIQTETLPKAPKINFGKYHALIIGNNKYRELERLNSAKKDAVAVAETLKHKYGFSVDLKLDATRSDVILALDGLRKKLTQIDNLLIYYAGHGWLDENADEGYWLPVDAARENPLNWVSNSQVTSSIKAMPAKHVLIVADSCYSGKMTRSVKKLTLVRSNNDYALIARKKSRSVLCSGGLEPVIDSGGKSGHSIFASAFLDVLNANNTIINGTELYSKIWQIVRLGADQKPEYSDIRKAGHEGGDFLFVPKRFLNHAK